METQKAENTGLLSTWFQGLQCRREELYKLEDPTIVEVSLFTSIQLILGISAVIYALCVVFLIPVFPFWYPLFKFGEYIARRHYTRHLREEQEEQYINDLDKDLPKLTRFGSRNFWY